MENRTQSGGNLPPPTPQYRTNANLSPPRTETPPKNLSGSLNSRGLKHWLGGMVNNPTTGALSSDKVWYSVMAGSMTWQFLTTDPAEWKWLAYGGILGGASLVKRSIAGVQQVNEKRIEKGE